MQVTRQPMKALDTQAKAAVLADGTCVLLSPRQYALVARLWRSKAPVKLPRNEATELCTALRRKGLAVGSRYGWGYYVERVTA